MESPRNTTRGSPSSGAPSFAFASRYLAKLGQSCSCGSITCRSRFRDSQGSATCCAVAVCSKNTLRRKTKVSFIMNRDTSWWIVQVTEKSRKLESPFRPGNQQDSTTVSPAKQVCHLLFGSRQLRFIVRDWNRTVYHPRGRAAR